MNYIINADDLGGYQNVNKPIIELLKDKIISQSTIMMTVSEYYNEAKFLVLENNLQDNIGIHLSLTRGRPLTETIRTTPFVSNKGYLCDRFFHNKIHYFYINKKIRKAIEIELDAQMKKYIADGFTLMHFDSHGNIHTYPSLYKIFIKVGKKNNFISTRLPFHMHSKNWLKNWLKNRITVNFKKNFKTTNLLTFSVKEIILFKKPNDSFEVMTHPGSNEPNEIVNIKAIRNEFGLPVSFKDL